MARKKTKLHAGVSRSDLECALSELFEEQRHRRDYEMQGANYFTGFCVVIAGWIPFLPNGLPLLYRVALSAIVVGAGVMAFLNLHRHARAYAETARVIVSINTRLGLFDDILPARWKQWGQRARRWPESIVLLAAAATLAILWLS